MAEITCIKVRITRNPTPHDGRPSMIWPNSWAEHAMHRNPEIHYDRTSGLSHYEDVEWAMAIVNTAVAELLLAADPDDYEEITDAVAEAFIEERCPPSLFEIDAQTVAAISARQAAGLALEPEELRALDPDDITPGVRRREKSIATRFGATVKPTSHFVRGA